MQLLAKQLLESVIREIKPQVVMLELDAGRLDDLPSGSSMKVGVSISLRSYHIPRWDFVALVG